MAQRILKRPTRKGALTAAVAVMAASALVFCAAAPAQAAAPGSITVGTAPNHIAFTRDGAHAYVSATDGVSVIDMTSNTVEPQSIAVGRSPSALVVSPNSAKVYVTNFDDGTVSVIDTDTNQLDATTPTVTVGA